MDRLDIRILHELYQGHTVWPARPGMVPPTRALARALEAPPGTVRNRVARMTESGLLRGVTVFVNPNLLGLESGSYAVEVAATVRKEEALRSLALIPRLVELHSFRGPLVGIGLAFANAPDLRTTLARVNRATGSHGGMFSRVAHPPCSITPTGSEWKLIVRLMKGGFSSYHELARTLGVPARTLRRRVARLVRAGAILTFPRIDLSAVVGGVTADLIVSFRDPPSRAESERRIGQLTDPWTIYAGPQESFNVYGLVLPNVVKANEIADEVGRLPGVSRSVVELVESIWSNFESLIPYAERRLSKSVPRPKH